MFFFFFFFSLWQNKEVDVNNKRRARIRIWALACEWHQPLIPTLFLSLLFPYFLRHQSLRSVCCWAGPSMYVHTIPLKCKSCEGRILSILLIILSPETILSNWHLEAIPCLLQHKNGFVWLFDCFVSHFVPASLSFRLHEVMDCVYSVSHCPSMTSKILGILYMTTKYYEQLLKERGNQTQVFHFFWKIYYINLPFQSNLYLPSNLMAFIWYLVT